MKFFLMSSSFPFHRTSTEVLSKKQLMQLNIRKTNNPIKKKIGRRPKQKLLQRRHTYFQKAHEKCSISLIIRAMKIKTTMRYHLIHTSQMSVIKNSTTNKCWRECGKKGTLVHSWWECKLIQSLWRIVLKYFLKIRNKTTIWHKQYHYWAYTLKKP